MHDLFFVWRLGLAKVINWINCFQGFALELIISSFKSLNYQIHYPWWLFDGILTYLTLHDGLIHSCKFIFMLHDMDHGCCGDKKHMFDTPSCFRSTWKLVPIIPSHLLQTTIQALHHHGLILRVNIGAF